VASIACPLSTLSGRIESDPCFDGDQSLIDSDSVLLSNE
jgi:hypothetical protein